MARLAQFIRPRRFFEIPFGNFGRSNNACLDQSGDLSELCAIRLDEHEGRANAEPTCFFDVGGLDDGNQRAAGLTRR